MCVCMRDFFYYCQNFIDWPNKKRKKSKWNGIKWNDHFIAFIPMELGCRVSERKKCAQLNSEEHEPNKYIFSLGYELSYNFLLQCIRNNQFKRMRSFAATPSLSWNMDAL